MTVQLQSFTTRETDQKQTAPSNAAYIVLPSGSDFSSKKCPIDILLSIL